MIGKIYRELLIIVVVFLAIWLGFTLLKPAPEIDFSISVENESEIGQTMADEIIEELGGLSSNNEYLTVLDSIELRLLKGLDETPFDYKFHLVSSDQVNAFAGMGGHIFVTEGIVDFCESADELAAIVAHEMGHVEHRHVLKKLSRDLGVAVLVLISSGGDPSVLAEVVKHTVSTSFSRSHEEEADRFGLELSEKSHLSPNKMTTVFIRLKTYTKENSMELPEFFSTHPDLSQRITNAAEYKVEEGFTELPLEVIIPKDDSGSLEKEIELFLE